MIETPRRPYAQVRHVADLMETMSRDIPITLIDPDPDQPRRHFDETTLQELADSLVANRQIVPITVRPVGERFVIVQGERRWRAAQLAGLATLRAEVSDIAPDAAYLLALIENLQRNDLTPLEEANAYERLLAGGYNQTSLGQRIGKSQSYIAQKLRLLKLPVEVQTALDEGKLSEGHARQLLRLEETGARVELAQHALGDSWTVDHLWHDVTLDLLVLHPSHNYKFSDLVEFTQKLATNRNSEGYPAHRLRAEYATGKILTFAKRIWEEYNEPNLAAGMLESMSLADIQAAMEIDRDLNRTGHDLRNLMELARLPKAKVDEVIQWVIAESSPYSDDESYWVEIARKLFPRVRQEREAMQPMEEADPLC